MRNYFVFVWDPDDRDSGNQIAAVSSTVLETQSWATAYGSDGVLVLHKTGRNGYSRTCHLTDDHGVILGSLYRRSQQLSEQSVVVQFDPSEVRRVVESRGRYLVEHYWGSYVAVVHDRSTRSSTVARDPTGGLACYRAKLQRAHVFFSDMEDFKRFIKAPVSINWRHIAARLLHGEQLSRECSLREVEDPPGGEWITISRAGESRKMLWHPGQFCGEGGLEDEQQAASELRTTVLNAVLALASEHSRILVRLSGGLDSSIVTSCLSQLERKPDVTCLNFYTSKGAGDDAVPVVPGLNKENLAKLHRVFGNADEREFARSVAARSGFRLIEREKRLSDWDIRRLWSAPLAPRPSNYVFVLDEDEAESELATESCATACFTGEAGDTVFYCTLRAIGALDYAYLHPFGPRLIHHILLTSKLSGESIGRVLIKVVRHGFLGADLPSLLSPAEQPHLLKDAAAREVPPQHYGHPWVDMAPQLCPGKRNHLLGIAHSVPYYHRVYHREQIAAAVHPLASQPVVETCLRIPSYVLLAGGTSRGLARLAFRDLLPPEVTRRTVKGWPAAFFQRRLRQNVKPIRERLLDGYLVREGLLDRRRLASYLTDDQPFFTVQPQQIMDYLACEAWVDQWLSA